MTQRPRLLLRADGGPRIGIGHLMRCLALGQAWQDLGGAADLATASVPPSLEARFGDEGIEPIPIPHVPGSPEDARAVAREAEARSAFVALDGYGFGPDYQELVAASARRLLLVADHGRPTPGPVDVLLDQNLGADAETYPDLVPSCRPLLGPRFALLRRELRAAACEPAERRHPPRRLLVTLGGGDDGGLGARLLDALARDPLGLREVTVVVGPAHSSWEALDGLLRSHPLRGTLVRDPGDMVPLIQGADVALSAAGSTCWELACLGLPAVVVAIADNQEPLGPALEARNAALYAGPADPGDAERAVALLRRLSDDPRLFASLREGQRTLVDGQGAWRVAECFLDQRPEPAGPSLY